MRRYRSFLTFLLVLFPVFMMISCEDEPSQVGLELKSVLGQAQPVMVDTINVYSSVVSMDSVRTDHFDYAVVGNFLDPVFGRTNASFVTQYRLSQPWSPGHNADVDSVKLFLVVDNYNGNMTTEQTLNVYESFKTLFFDSLYYSNFQVKDSISEWPVGSAVIHPVDTMIVVYLSKTFGRKILRDTAVLKNQDLFLSHFKGLYIDVDKASGINEGGLVKINLLTRGSYMAIYYHNDLNPHLMFPFYFNSYSARVNLYEHDYEEAPAATRIKYLDQGIEDSVMYVQGLGGVYTRLDLSGISIFRDSSIILNSVKLIIPVDTTVFTPAERPGSLSMRFVQDGTFYNIVDTRYPEFYDGTLDDKTGLYTIGMTQHFQDYLLGRNDQTVLYLMVNNPSQSTGRIVLRSRLNSDPMVLKIVYTRK